MTSQELRTLRKQYLTTAPRSFIFNGETFRWTAIGSIGNVFCYISDIGHGEFGEKRSIIEIHIDYNYDNDLYDIGAYLDNEEIEGYEGATFADFREIGSLIG